MAVAVSPDRDHGTARGNPGGGQRRPVCHLDSGLRAGGGTETLGEFLRATLTETDETLEPWNAGMILTARVAAVLETCKPVPGRRIPAVRYQRAKVYFMRQGQSCLTSRRYRDGRRLVIRG